LTAALAALFGAGAVWAAAAPAAVTAAIRAPTVSIVNVLFMSIASSLPPSYAIATCLGMAGGANIFLNFFLDFNGRAFIR
jgi:hypothetical protein